jgi:chromosome partitioning protein
MATDTASPIHICLINQKGGCGKSSTCFHLAGSLAALGKRVLLIDADPQGSISQAFLGPEVVERLDPEQTLAAVFDTDALPPPADLLIRETHCSGISLIPANHHMAEFNRPQPERSGLMQFALRDLLSETSVFDFILLDCPPNLYQCSWNAMLAADHVLIPIPPEDFGTQGIRAVHQAIANARILNPTLRRLGHLITRCDRRMLVHRAYEQQLRNRYGPLVLQTTIPELSAFKVALSCRLPVEFHDPRSAAAESMRALTTEILNRIEHKTRILTEAA